MSTDYFALPGVNWSSLKWMRESPLMYHYRREHPQADTPAFALGRAVHALVFEPDTFNRDYVIWEGGTRRGKEWDEFCEANDGRTIFKEAEIEVCIEMADAVRRHPLVQPYLEAGRFEVPLQWTDPATGLLCKGKPDWLLDDARILLDLKTTRSINGRRFGAEAARFGYHNQMAFYRAGVKHALGWYPERVLIVAVEKEPPHDVGIFEATFEDLYAGEEENDELLRMVKACQEADRWPGRYTEEQALQLPAWVTMDDDEDPESYGLVAGESHG